MYEKYIFISSGRYVCIDPVSYTHLVLVVQTYAANPEYGIAGFVKPEDKVENRLMLEFHYYQPWNYCSANAEDKRYYWGLSLIHIFDDFA